MIEKHVPPVFARRQWAEAENSVCLLVSDPIHNFTRDSSCGWFLLGEDEFMPRLLELRASLLAQWGLRGTVWHGLSSGGYAAMKYCMRGGADDLAFVVSPHNDPLILPQWTREAAPFSHLPSMARPERMTDIIEDWTAPGSARCLHVVIPEKDSYFALEHLRPIMEHLDGHPSLRAVMLRDGRGHGFIANSDYTSQLGQAVDRWERHRGEHAAAAGTRGTVSGE
ncbi:MULTISPECIES: hypothetical protein [unclassified Streptomyces]|uniref:hypothetical protein n=1 Tax=unclassified Streptomyces TaxID=2593676 RepID=UPI002366C262|nr:MULTISPECIES: hypothetical protein [unclassified Streptomyces]MDF3142786.1 hypothetical protein [Streptomyces sp. T21Q-yed]WDF42867.1 hypothetical protein PBV52_41790 [Streptomyces sp. T12]